MPLRVGISCGLMPPDPERSLFKGKPLAYGEGHLSAAVARAGRLPVLGVCRGIQILNAALGGRLWQDIDTQLAGARGHRDWDRYDDNEHRVRIEPGSWLAQVHGAGEHLVNSVHHQAIRTVAP